jgi:hypothetical protein
MVLQDWRDGSRDNQNGRVGASWLQTNMDSSPNANSTATQGSARIDTSGLCPDIHPPTNMPIEKVIAIRKRARARMRTFRNRAVTEGTSLACSYARSWSIRLRWRHYIYRSVSRCRHRILWVIWNSPSGPPLRAHSRSWREFGAPGTWRTHRHVPPVNSEPMTELSQRAARSLGVSTRGTARGAFVRSSKNGVGRLSPRTHQPRIFDACPA